MLNYSHNHAYYDAFLGSSLFVVGRIISLVSPVNPAIILIIPEDYRADAKLWSLMHNNNIRPWDHNEMLNF